MLLPTILQLALVAGAFAGPLSQTSAKAQNSAKAKTTSSLSVDVSSISLELASLKAKQTTASSSLEAEQTTTAKLADRQAQTSAKATTSAKTSSLALNISSISLELASLRSKLSTSSSASSSSIKAKQTSTAKLADRQAQTPAKTTTSATAKTTNSLAFNLSSISLELASLQSRISTLTSVSSSSSSATAKQTSTAKLDERDISIQAPPQYLTISVINSFAGDVTTNHVQGTPGPSPVSGDTNPGTMTPGQTAVLAVPTGWTGNIAFNNASFDIQGDESLLEASFVVPTNYSVAVADVDVSNVNGFTIAASCSCNDVVVTGCNFDLWTMNACPNNNNEGSCTNPTRPSTTIKEATTFFAPCSGMSYSYPIDDAANSFGACQSGTITCCIGTDCPANPKQAQASGSAVST